MVQKYQSPVRVYKYSFEMVMAAYEKRFPTCAMIPVFLGSEILNETLSTDGAKQVTERRCCLAVDAPYLLKKIVGTDCIYFNQKNSLDRRKRTLKIESHNESFSSRILINENCHYAVHPENADWTCFEQDASLDVKSFMGFEATIEKIAMRQYTANIQKGKEVIEFYINELLSEGVTYIPTWSETQQTVPTPMPAQLSSTVSLCDTPEYLLNTEPSLTPSGSPRTSCASQHHLLLDQSHNYLQVGRTCKLVSHADAFETACVSQPMKINVSRQEKSYDTDCANFSLEGEGKLEADYIQRFLGALSPYQESKLVQLRRWLQDTLKEKIPKDSHILRFLKARDFNIEKGREMICHSLAWRKLHGIDKLLTTYEPLPAIQKFYPAGWHFHDKDGRPLYILRLGQMDVKGLAKAVGYENILKHVLAVNEEGLKRCEEATQKFEHPVTNWTCVIDLEGLSMRHLWRPGVRALLKIIEIVEANYPETLAHLLIVRAPRVFPVLWTLISPFIDERTRDKFLIYGGKDCLGPGGLVDFIEQQYVPDFLNGSCYCAVSEGGIVPKSMYISLSEEDLLEKDKCSQRDDAVVMGENIYHTAYVVKEFPHEVLLQVPQRGCVITWDFDILKGDVTFTLLRCRRQISSPPHTHHMSGAVGGVASVQYVDKRCAVGIDIMLVEASIICRDGDSIQGSHVASQGGSYILQWKWFDQVKGSFDLLSTHKSKVMYYTEVLLSERFRGSVSSLQSSHSGFSQLSLSKNNDRRCVDTPFYQTERRS